MLFCPFPDPADRHTSTCPPSGGPQGPVLGRSRRQERPQTCHSTRTDLPVRARQFCGAPGPAMSGEARRELPLHDPSLSAAGLGHGHQRLGSLSSKSLSSFPFSKSGSLLNGRFRQWPLHYQPNRTRSSSPSSVGSQSLSFGTQRPRAPSWPWSTPSLRCSGPSW